MKRWRRAAAVAGVVVVLAACLPTSDVRWFGWVNELGDPHRVCGSASQNAYGGSTPYVKTLSMTWYQGFGTNDPGCYDGASDWVDPGWLAAAVHIWRTNSSGDWYRCAATLQWSFNPDFAPRWSRSTSCVNPSGDQQWQSEGHHLWWAYDYNGYAGDSNWTPVGTG